MERIEGKRIGEYITADVAKECLKACFILDTLGINKEEMKNPYKHIIISHRIVFIDFERSVFSKNPRNVTQFCAYLSKFFEIPRDVLRMYAKNRSFESFKALLSCIKHGNS